MTARLFILLAFAISLLPGQPQKTRNVVLLTADGLRWQEVFQGIDASLINRSDAGMNGAEQLRERLWRETAEERRAVLLPYFWGEFAPRGIVYGNRAKGSFVNVANRYRVSYPGYSEIVTGRTQDEAVTGNREIHNPTQTVLEFVREQLRLDRTKVALFGSWQTFRFIAESRPGSVFINAGYSGQLPDGASGRLTDLARLQAVALTPFRTVRHDCFTCEMALEYLKTYKPRLLYIALGETDDWAHARRYDLTLETASYFDACLQQLTAALESLEEYRGSTSILVSTDHGRGLTQEDWHSHGTKVEGADQTWLAVWGPDTPAVGEAVNAPQIYQRDIAPTILEMLGIEPSRYQGVEGKPVAWKHGVETTARVAR